jgi:hypothetical protein
LNLDLSGAALLALSLAALTLWLTFASRWGWTSPQFWIVIGAGILALAATVRVERRAPHPVLDPALFSDPRFIRSSIGYGASFVCLYAVLILVPLNLASSRAIQPQLIGVLITPLLAMMVLAAPLARALTTRWSPGAVSACGMLCLAAGLVLLSAFSSGMPVWFVAVGTFVAGLGVGLFYPSNNFAYMATAPAGRRGVASAFLATLRTVGGSFGAAGTTALFAALGGTAAAEAVGPAYQLTLLTAAASAATIAVVVATKR